MVGRVIFLFLCTDSIVRADRERTLAYFFLLFFLDGEGGWEGRNYDYNNFYFFHFSGHSYLSLSIYIYIYTCIDIHVLHLYSKHAKPNKLSTEQSIPPFC